MGLVEKQKSDWVDSEDLRRFYINYNIFKIFYSNPSISKSIQVLKLTRSQEKEAQEAFLRVLSIRMESGCLVVIDKGNIKTGLITTMAKVYGYSVFYKVFPIPQDYIVKPDKYSSSLFEKKKREDLQEEVNKFLNIQLNGCNLIDSYIQVEDYYKTDPSGRTTYLGLTLDSSDVYVFSDIHGNYSLLEKALNMVGKDSLKIFLGDYIDGEEPGGSRKVIDFINNISMYDSNYLFLEGDHEIKLMKYLYCISKKNSKSDPLRKIFIESLPEEWLQTTAKEFDDLEERKAGELLNGLRRKLFSSLKVTYKNCIYYITHAGLYNLNQLSPKFIGSVIYESSDDMIDIDRSFSKTMHKNYGMWSIHGHCKYRDYQDLPSKEDGISRFAGVINLDPQTEKGIDKPEIILFDLKNSTSCIVQ